MSLREYFAVMALQGLLAHSGYSVSDAASDAVLAADILIAVLNDEQE